MFNLSIFGGSHLGKRPWRPGKRVWSITLLGGTSMSFEEARLEEGETTVTCIAFLGGAVIIVPPAVPVTVSGISLLGGRDVKAVEAGPESGSGSWLHVRAFTVLGGVEIKPP